jgi:threonine/homoserine/homoserine lactone efflux protein
MIQLGIDRKMNIAWRFASAAALIEYPYAWIAVAFEEWITSSPAILDNFKLISATVLILLGAINIRAAQRPTVFTQKFQESGFRRGVILSILNPLAMPFWIAITAYLNVQGWINLSTKGQLHSYLVGISIGAFILLILAAFIAKKRMAAYQPSPKVKLIPGLVLLALGIYAFIEYLF